MSQIEKSGKPSFTPSPHMKSLKSFHGYEDLTGKGPDYSDKVPAHFLHVKEYSHKIQVEVMGPQSKMRALFSKILLYVAKIFGFSVTWEIDEEQSDSVIVQFRKNSEEIKKNPEKLHAFLVAVKSALIKIPRNELDTHPLQLFLNEEVYPLLQERTIFQIEAYQQVIAHLQSKIAKWKAKPDTAKEKEEEEDELVEASTGLYQSLIHDHLYPMAMMQFLQPDEEHSFEGIFSRLKEGASPQTSGLPPEIIPFIDTTRLPRA